MIKTIRCLLLLSMFLQHSLQSSSASSIRGKNSVDDESNLPFRQSDVHFSVDYQQKTIQRKLDHVSVTNCFNL